MERLHLKDRRILAIDPTSRGFGFVVLEGSERLVDWGVKETRTAKDLAILRQVSDLIEIYRPDLLITEDERARGCRRCARVQRLLREIRAVAEKRRVRTRCVARRKMKVAFAGSGVAPTKHGIAVAIAARFPELAPRVPPPRKPWMSEDARMSIFDAAALALASTTSKGV